MPGRPPSVDQLARSLAGTGLPHPLLVDAARQAVAGGAEGARDRAAQAALDTARRLLRPVVNATGVLLHTNLGRAPLSVERPAVYSNLELDLATGRRGNRSVHAGALLARACGAEAALVVNNGAAAVLLALSALAAGKEVLVSRGELVEIGGGFRIPEVLTSSGALLVEVGTTNRTRPSDYAAALSDRTAAILKVHQSNFRITGFTQAAAVSELAALAGERPVVADLGSGLLDETCPWIEGGPPGWLRGEPAARQTLEAGASLVTWSGDKLLGGPQAGVIAGRAELVELCARHPLARALRPGGLVLEALQEVALSYLRRDAARSVPLWKMALTPLEELRRRAEAISVGEVVDCESTMGGGTLPGVTIPSAGIALPGDLTSALRRWDPPVVARVAGDMTICDLRTVWPDQDEVLRAALAAAEGGMRGHDNGAAVRPAATTSLSSGPPFQGEEP